MNNYLRENVNSSNDSLPNVVFAYDGSPIMSVLQMSVRLTDGLPTMSVRNMLWVGWLGQVSLA